jgi:hypothetical protein
VTDGWSFRLTEPEPERVAVDDGERRLANRWQRPIATGVTTGQIGIPVAVTLRPIINVTSGESGGQPDGTC